ncbi:MHS family MFS transporter [Aureimonas leprariae]|uniref:MHS family MFS transporter n=2 Tax=Plantimonas leprariae TaxID=2615207 RepID=A0A7V7PRW2_9HYPH|nr:MHS family MFS transporter [Aureimonas leprariae]
MTREERKVIFASSLGTVFEWYDFYLAGSLAIEIGKNFLGGVNPTASLIFTLLIFAVGFAVRPFGAIVFGRLGDLAGRKYTFLVTILIMGASTFLVGLLPGYATIGIWAPILFVFLRVLQGLALGGEYGGAATYVAEHAPAGRRGFYTSFIQTTATLGLFLSLIVILLVRQTMSPEDFAAWGWRIPFLLSIVLLGISVWIRMQLHESPLFAKMKAEGKGSTSPLRESFGQWGNLKIVLLALFGVAMGQAVVWYAGQFYALIFLKSTLRIEGMTAEIYVAIALALATPCFLFFGWLSDRIGRKPIILTGCVLACVTYFPIFGALTHYGNPALFEARSSNPVTVAANPADCSVQFNPFGAGVIKFTSPCDVATAALTSRGVPYAKVDGPAGAATVSVGQTQIQAYDGTAPDAAAQKTAFDKQLGDTLTAAGYAAKADPARINAPAVIGLLFILVLYVTMVYGPIAAMLVEMFPTRIRYTSMSLPYHVANGWFGGFLPASATAIVAATGDIYAGLWYPIVFAAITVLIGILFVREPKGSDIDALV